jgi:hypothetical protein
MPTMKTIVDKDGINTIPGEISLVIKGVLYVGETNILKKIESLQEQLAELDQIKDTLRTLQSVVDALGIAGSEGVAEVYPQAAAKKSGTVKTPKKTTQEAA